MKKFILSLLLVAFFSVFTISCEKDNEPVAPELPPYESMVIDFSKLKVDATKSIGNVDTTTMANWQFAKGNVGFWSLITGTTLAVPVASFYASFQNKANYLGDNKWQWSYEVKGFTSKIIARLTGELMTDEIKWEMYITKEGIGGYAEFKWFEGVSDINRESGQWTLYHSYDFQEEVLTIDWEKDSDVIGMVKYTYVRKLNNARETEPGYGSYLTFGLQEGDYNAFFNIYFYDIWSQSMVNVDIEWSTTEYFGHVKAPHKFDDELWHCWDSYGYDAVCTK